jgi:CxxC motif-containing protein
MHEEKKLLTCIICPLGCRGEVSISGRQVNKVQGFTCPRGAAYARQETMSPTRMLTTTVHIKGAKLPLLPVVSASPLPKDRLLPCAQHLTKLSVTAPVTIGQVICSDILGLGVDILASRDLS